MHTSKGQQFDYAQVTKSIRQGTLGKVVYEKVIHESSTTIASRSKNTYTIEASFVWQHIVAHGEVPTIYKNGGISSGSGLSLIVLCPPEHLGYHL